MGSQDAIFRMGGVASLIRVVQHGSSAARGYAAGALSSLAEGGPLQRDAVIHSGAIPPLAVLAREGTPKSAHLAAVALRQLVARAPEAQDNLTMNACPATLI